jgi:hypothetical protein
MGKLLNPYAFADNFGETITLTRTRIGSNASSTDATSYTFTAQGIGTAAADRFVLLAVGSEASTGGMATTDVTVTANAGAMTRVKDIKAGSGGSGQGAYAGLWILKITTGTTADFVVDFGAFTQQHIGIEVYTITGNASLNTTPFDSDTTSAGSAVIDIPVGGVAIGVGVAVVSNVIAWSAGLTLDHGQALELTAAYVSAASSNTPGLAQTVTITNCNAAAIASFGQ